MHPPNYYTAPFGQQLRLKGGLHATIDDWQDFSANDPAEAMIVADPETRLPSHPSSLAYQFGS